MSSLFVATAPCHVTGVTFLEAEREQNLTTAAQALLKLGLISRSRGEVRQ